MNITEIFRKIWRNAIIREFILFVASALSIVILAQLQALDTLFEEGITMDEIKVWSQAAASAVFITAFRQAVAYVIAHLAELHLGDTRTNEP